MDNKNVEQGLKFDDDKLRWDLLPIECVEDVVKILKLADFELTKSELNALYRNPTHPNYKECGDQLLRNFLNGLIIFKRGPMPKKEDKSL